MFDMGELRRNVGIESLHEGRCVFCRSGKNNCIRIDRVCSAIEHVGLSIATDLVYWRRKQHVASTLHDAVVHGACQCAHAAKRSCKYLATFGASLNSAVRSARQAAALCQ